MAGAPRRNRHQGSIGIYAISYFIQFSDVQIVDCQSHTTFSVTFRSSTDFIESKVIEQTLKSIGPKEQQIMRFLHERIFDPILESPTASQKLKQGVRYTIMRLEERDAAGMINYYWSAIVGTEKSVGFAARMRSEGFERFEEAIDEFRVHFNDNFLKR